jgi:NitT/TauT family transport system substrate-binding protein
MSLRKTVLVAAGGWIVVIGVLHAALNLGLFTRKERREATFKVGFLPVTCHLTCPVNHYIQKNLSGDGGFEPIRFNGWRFREAFPSRWDDATFILALMAMKPDRAPVKIVYPVTDGTASYPRDRRSSASRTLREEGTPNRFSNQRLLKVLDDAMS